ncbi:hypothetical protein LIA77_11160 [Sarocladium implicatum]|nr:hypothetical protein LIA77_11160 [Sarocladium implicatum]
MEQQVAGGVRGWMARERYAVCGMRYGRREGGRDGWGSFSRVEGRVDRSGSRPRSAAALSLNVRKRFAMASNNEMRQSLSRALYQREQAVNGQLRSQWSGATRQSEQVVVVVVVVVVVSVAARGARKTRVRTSCIGPSSQQCSIAAPNTDSKHTKVGHQQEMRDGASAKKGVGNQRRRVRGCVWPRSNAMH